MRWMWIDTIIELAPGERMVSVKNVTLAEEHLHDHFPADPDLGLGALPIMPASLIIEGMAQTAGILVGHTRNFAEKVILAKVSKAELERDVVAGQTILYTATIDRLDDAGASTRGKVDVLDHVTGERFHAGSITLIFSHIDKNMAGMGFPEHNFVFGEGFKTILRTSGIDFDTAR